MKKLSALIGMMGFLVLNQMSALVPHARAENLRLIDTGNGKLYWAAPAELERLSAKSHALHRCGGYFDRTSEPADQATLNKAPLASVEAFNLSLADRPLTQKVFLNQALPLLDSARVQESVKSLSAFKNRYYSSDYGVRAAEWIAAEFKKQAGNRNDIDVSLFKHSFKQPSVIATIKGQGPHASEIVIIGGHEDSINLSSIFGSSEQVAPGADDNASGIATVLEVYRVLVQSGFKSDRTLAFMAYAGEEKGLLGSQDIANQWKREKKSVVAVAQFDMTGFDGSQDQVVFMTDFTQPALTQYTEKLMDTYVQTRWTSDRCGYACSDHASWYKAGYASVMPFEAKMGEDNQAIHSKNDVIALIDFNHAMHFTKLALAFAAELSNDSAK